MTCDWAPTGVEFVSGSWDRTVRIWSIDSGGGKSRDVYHTKRMQRVFSTIYTPDSHFVLSGSDDGNIRLWKSHSSTPLSILTTRERSSIEYRQKLVSRWRHDSEIGRISRKRHLPKSVFGTGKLKRSMEDSARGKEERRRKHTREGDGKPKAERRKVVIAEQS